MSVQSDELRAGAAAVEIPVPAGLPLIGFGARGLEPAHGLHDPICARAIVLQRAGAPLVLCAVDLLGVSAEMRRDVLARVGAILPEDRVALAATHTESAPGCIFSGELIEAFFGSFRPDFYETVVEAMAAAIRSAHSRMRPASLGVESVHIDGLTQNSRHPEAGPVDDEVGILRLTGSDGRPLALACVCCAHNTALDHRNMYTSADVGGVFCRAIERALPGAVGLFFAGEQGDLGLRRSRFPDDDAFALADAIGSDLARRVLEVAARTPLDSHPRLDVACERFNPPPPTVPISRGPILMQALILGESGWLVVPGEPIAEIGLLFKRHILAAGLRQAHVIALANDQLGYVLTRDEFRAGGYQPTVSFFGETFGEVFVEAGLRTFDLLK